MVFGTIISGCLFILPAAVTTGVLVGWDAIRSGGNQKPLFTVPPGGGMGGGPGITPDRGNKILTEMYCDESTGIAGYFAPGYEAYTLNPNPWGWTEGTPGALCMSVTSYQNGTYPSKTTAPEWSVTWQYPQGPLTQPVHAFPNIKLDANKDSAIPVEISGVNKIEVDVEWYYGVGSIAPTSVDAAALTSAQANTNVAIDMFLDDDKNNAQNPEKAKYEVMVWLAAFGTATQPIGYPTVKATQVINTVTFNLYWGSNGLGQTVMTWMVPAGTIANQFYGDLSPLVKFDYSTLTDPPTGVTPPKSNTYLGYVGLGSEAYWSGSNVTLSVPKLSMDVN